MTTEGVLALGMLLGIGIGVVWAYLWAAPTISDLKYDLWAAEDEIHERDKEDRWNIVWESESERLMRQHAGTPYLRRDKYGAWGEDAA